ncbi:hypothetical protein AA906_14935 [Geobacillus stearothermophilus]|nr:hypothetical protein AA906_14935 [Geobacillus stearothermophilus]
MDTKNPPDFRWEGAKCEFHQNNHYYSHIIGIGMDKQIDVETRVSQDFVENIFSVHYGCCQSLVSKPFSGIGIVSAFGLSSLILK